MEESIENTILGTITKVDEAAANLSVQKDIEAQALKITGVTDTTPASASPSSRATDGQGKNIGRNDPCPCGAINPNTGKVYKYKQCGLINAPHHKK